MTRLLVSVRSGPEAQAALDGGADLIDVKEPARGALGAANASVWNDVARVVRGRRPISAALGELIDGQLLGRSPELAPFDFAKTGLARCGRLVDWPRRWQDSLGGLPEQVTPVAVVYADWRAAEAPAPDDVIEHAAQLHCGAILFDTFDKTRGGLLDHFNIDELQRLSARVRGCEARVVLAGSLDARSIARLLPLRPDCVAVRGAACRRGRNSRIDPSRVRELARILACRQGIGDAASQRKEDSPRQHAPEPARPSNADNFRSFSSRA